jgi:hypothetical protein
MRIKLKNIILSIWIEEWDKKNQLKFYKIAKTKKLKIQRMNIILKNIIFDKLKFEYETKNK